MSWKEKRKKERRSKKIHKILEWMDIQRINHEGIYLQRGSQTRVVKGIQIEPINIYLLPLEERVNRIYALANAYDKLKFDLYLKCVRKPPDLDRYFDQYQNYISREDNPAIKKLIQIQFDGLDWFYENQREVSFYMLIQETEDLIEKRFDMLVQEFLKAGFNIKVMSASDYEKIVSNEFENETVNEYMFTHLLLPEDLQEVDHD